MRYINPSDNGNLNTMSWTFQPGLSPIKLYDTCTVLADKIHTWNTSQHLGFTYNPCAHFCMLVSFRARFSQNATRPKRIPKLNKN